MRAEKSLRLFRTTRQNISIHLFWLAFSLKIKDLQQLLVGYSTSLLVINIALPVLYGQVLLKTGIPKNSCW